jgi:hypothetical protein
MRDQPVLSGLLLPFIFILAGEPRTTAQDGKSYDLRGPAPIKGQVTQNKMNLKIKDATTTIHIAGDKPIVLKTAMEVVHEREQEFLEIEGRSVAKYRIKIIKDRTELGFEGMPKSDPIRSELEGESIIGERIDGPKWKHSLVRGNPSENQKAELEKRPGFESDDELYPSEKIKVGDTWNIEAVSLTRLFDDSFSDLSGEIKRTFMKVEEIDTEECALIQSSGVVKGKMKDETGAPSMLMEMDLKLTSWRSLKTGISVKEQFEGKIKLSGTQTVEGEKVRFSVSGPFNGESITQSKR